MLDDDPDDGEDEDNDRAGGGAVAVGGGQCLPALLLAVERRRVAQWEELSPHDELSSSVRPPASLAADGSHHLCSSA